MTWYLPIGSNERRPFGAFDLEMGRVNPGLTLLGSASFGPSGLVAQASLLAALRRRSMLRLYRAVLHFGYSSGQITRGLS